MKIRPDHIKRAVTVGQYALYARAKTRRLRGAYYTARGICCSADGATKTASRIATEGLSDDDIEAVKGMARDYIVNSAQNAALSSVRDILK